MTSYGIGKQYIKSYDKKRIVEGVNVINSGSGYENKKRTVKSAIGISTALNQITISNHDYKSGEVINYVETTDTIIGGLSENTEYYVTAVDSDTFKLSSVPTSSKISIFDLNGKKIKTLNHDCENLFCSVKWDGKDLNLKQISNGTYIYHLELDNNEDIFKGIYKITKLK